MRSLIIIVCFVAAGCAAAGSSSCEFDLASPIWVRVEPKSNHEIAPISESSDWFVNSNGDYLICYNMGSDETCNGIYELFTRQPDGEFLRQEIVCT